MNKLFTKITSLALGAAMMIGVGVSVGSKSVSKADADVAELTVGSITSDTSVNDNQNKSWDITADGDYSSNASYIQAGTNSKQVSYVRLVSSDYSTCLISKVQVWGTSKANTNVTPKVYIGTTLIGEGSKYTSQTASSGGTEFVANNTNELQGDLKIEISRASKATGAIYFNKAIVTYSAGGGSDPVKGTLTISDPGTITEGKQGTFAYTLTGGTETSLSSQNWSSSDDNIIEITNSSTGAYNAIGTGPATITLTGADASGFSYTTDVGGGAATRSVTVVADPFASFVKVTSTSSMSETDVYAFGDETKQYFAANSINNKALQIVTTLTNIGYFALNSDGHIVPCTKNGNTYTVVADEFVNNNSGTDLALETSGKSAWEGVDYSGAVILENTSNSNRYLGFNSNGSPLSAATGIKAYALASGDPQTNYPFVCLYKVGELAGVQYSVTYNSNAAGTSGTTVDSNSPYDKGSNVTVLANGFTYTGHSFTGWNTAADGTGTPYQPNATISSISANVTLYAQWEEVDYIDVKSPKVTIALNSSYDLTNNLVLYGEGALTITPATSEYYTLSGTTLTARKETASDLTLTISKENVQNPVSFDIQIKKQSQGTIDDPFSPEEARAKATEAGDSGTSEGYYVAGYIIGKVEISNGRAQLYIGAEKTSTTTLYIYNMNGYENNNDLTSTSLVAGDYIVAFGMLKTYNNVPQLCWKQSKIDCKLIYTTPVDGLSISLDTDAASLYFGETHTLSVTVTTREYHAFYYYEFVDSTIGEDYEFDVDNDVFTAGSTKGHITYKVTACDGKTTAQCVITVNKHIAPPSGDGGYELTPITSLTSSDVFVIVGKNANGSYAMTNTNGASKAPATSAVTIEDGKITSEVTSDILWNISSSSSGYTFYPNGDNESWLYTTSTNDGVRVGTNANKVFTIAEGYLKNTSTNRYVGIYNSQDWRCYTSINSNITGQTFTYYKYVEGTETSNLTYFCQQILEFLECDETGVTPPSTSEWGELKGLFETADFLTTEEISTLKTTTAASYDDELPADPTDNDYLIYGLAKYDYVIAKYGRLEDSEHNKLYANFLERTVTPLPGSGRILIDSLFGSSNSTATTVVIIISVIGVSALGGFFFLRKRKEI